MTKAPSVRAWLAEATHEAHVRLHVHRTIGRLTEPDVTEAEYRHVLSGFHAVFSELEAQRAGAEQWPEFAIAEHCAALACDLPADTGTKPVEFYGISTPAAHLGALYAVHGAQFGGAIIKRNLCRALPRLPHHYFSMPNQPERWRKLITEIELVGKDAFSKRQLSMGARQVFDALDLACSLTEKSPLTAATN